MKFAPCYQSGIYHDWFTIISNIKINTFIITKFSCSSCICRIQTAHLLFYIVVEFVKKTTIATIIHKTERNFPVIFLDLINKKICIKIIRNKIRIRKIYRLPALSSIVPDTTAGSTSDIQSYLLPENNSISDTPKAYIPYRPISIPLFISSSPDELAKTLPVFHNEITITGIFLYTFYREFNATVITSTNYTNLFYI